MNTAVPTINLKTIALIANRGIDADLINETVDLGLVITHSSASTTMILEIKAVTDGGIL